MHGRIRRSGSALVLAVLVVLHQSGQQAMAQQYRYTITNLGKISEGDWVRPTSINDLGQVVGYCDSLDGLLRGFIYSDGQMQEVGSSEGQFVPWAINSRGDIAGTLYDDNYSGRAFLYSNGRMTDLFGGQQSYAYAMNNLGQVVGWGPNGGFLYSNGQMGRFGSAPGHAINDLGQIIGWGAGGGVLGYSSSLLYTNGQAESLGNLGVDDCQAEAINNSGQVVGFSRIVGGDRHAFLHSNGKINDLGTLGGARKLRPRHQRRRSNSWLGGGI